MGRLRAESCCAHSSVQLRCKSCLALHHVVVTVHRDERVDLSFFVFLLSRSIPLPLLGSRLIDRKYCGGMVLESSLLHLCLCLWLLVPLLAVMILVVVVVVALMLILPTLLGLLDIALQRVGRFKIGGGGDEIGCPETEDSDMSDEAFVGNEDIIGGERGSDLWVCIHLVSFHLLMLSDCIDFSFGVGYHRSHDDAVSFATLLPRDAKINQIASSRWSR